MARVRILPIACATVLAAAALVACDVVFGVHDAEWDAGGEGDGGLDAPIDVVPDYVLGDVVDFDANTAVCDGGVTVVGADAAVWVSATGSDTNGCGGTENPCASVGFALGVAGSTTKYLYLDHATFTENVTLGANQAGLTIQGGFERGADGGWTPSCDNSLTWIQAPPDGGSAAVDIQNAPNVTLRLLTIRSKQNGEPGTGESVYAVRVVDSNPVDLENVTLIAQHGGDGRWGGGGQTASGCTTGGSGNGQAGAVGNPSGSGTFGAGGFVPDTAASGQPGSLGTSTSGSPGASTSCVSSCTP